MDNANLLNRELVLDTLETTPLHIDGIRIGKTIFSQYGEQCRVKLFEAVKQLPVSDAEYIRHGYWEVVGKTEAGSNIIRCSVCGKERKGAGKSNYCRDCGAKMDAR